MLNVLIWAIAGGWTLFAIAAVLEGPIVDWLHLDDSEPLVKTLGVVALLMLIGLVLHAV